MIDLDNLPKRSWTPKPTYSFLCDKLAQSHDRDFEKVVLSLLQIIWQTAQIPPSLGELDKSGIDIICWSNFQPFPLTVQCKGFKVLEEDIGKSQIDQCLKSVSKFQESGIKSEIYLLIHNRTGKNENLRKTVELKLKELTDSKQVKRAELWDRQKFLAYVFNYALQISQNLVKGKQINFIKNYVENNYFDTLLIAEPIKNVPHSIRKLTFDPNQLLDKTGEKVFESNPVEKILNSDISNLTLLIGEAGYGKTTTMLQTFSNDYGLLPIFLPASTIPKEVNSIKGLLSNCIKIEQIIEIPVNADISIFTDVFETTLQSLFTNENETSPLILLIDGLDESVYIGRRGGINSLFNQLKKIKIPLVLTARKEFWLSRETSFSESIGEIAHSPDKRHRRKIQMIELLAWGKKQICELANLYKETLNDDSMKANINYFIKIIEQENYEKFYGDIPKRPLFLRFILETVAQNGVEETGRAKLYYKWAKQKVIRDIKNPMRWGDIGRLPIISDEPEDETLRLSFLAMMSAARRMTQKKDSYMIELLPDCELDAFLCSNEHFKKITDPTGLFLNSLLFPIQAEFLGQTKRIKFAHRTFQEFFLALHLKNNPEELFIGDKFPDSVMNFLNDINNEGLN